MKNAELMIFSGSANKALSDKICDHLKINLSPSKIRTFSDGEIFAKSKVTVRGADVFVIQPTCPPVNDNLMELLIMIDSLKRASAGRITAVVPYYGYARQDKKDEPRAPVTADLVADMIMVAGAKRCLFVDLHNNSTQNSFKKIPVDHFYAMPVILKHIPRHKDIIVISTDAGGVARTRAYAKRLDVDLAIIDKRRERANVAQAMNVIGDVRGKTAVLIDDMVDTAGTLCAAAEILMTKGASDVYAACTHGILSGPAIDRLNKSQILKLMVTNSIPQERHMELCSKIEVLDISELLASGIFKIHNNESVGELFI